MKIQIALIGLVALMLVGCSSGSETPTPTTGASVSTLTLTSTAFASQQPIPGKYSCDGQNISPPLQWGEPPAGTKSFALTVDDPDAPSGTFVHWVIYSIPATARSLGEGVPANATLPDGSKQGRNGAGRTGYTGPCPPGGTHHYFFKLYALDANIGLATGATKEELEAAIQGRVLAYGELVGTYSR